VQRRILLGEHRSKLSILHIAFLRGNP